MRGCSSSGTPSVALDNCRPPFYASETTSVSKHLAHGGYTLTGITHNIGNSIAAKELPPTDGFWLPDFHPDLDAVVLGLMLLGIYVICIRDARTRGISLPVGTGRIVSYVLGTLIMVAASSWPLHDLSEGYLFSMHMVQHMLFIFVAAPLLLWGFPNWLLEILFEPEPLHSIVKVCARPIPAFLLFNLGQGLLHVPEITNVVIQNHTIHYFVHIYIMASALLIWFPVMSSIPGLPRLSYPYQMVYLMLQSVIPTVIYAPLTYATDPVYQWYAQAPHIWGMSAATDQQIAGLLMKIGGGLIVWGWITVAFFKWFAQSNANAVDEFAPMEELSPRSVVRAAEDVLHESRK